MIKNQFFLYLSFVIFLTVKAAATNCHCTSREYCESITGKHGTRCHTVTTCTGTACSGRFESVNVLQKDNFAVFCDLLKNGRAVDSGLVSFNWNQLPPIETSEKTMELKNDRFEVTLTFGSNFNGNSISVIRIKDQKNNSMQEVESDVIPVLKINEDHFLSCRGDA